MSDSSNNPTGSLPPLDDPSKWATGGDAATDRQKDFVAQLAVSTSAHDVNIDGLSKGDASAKIEELKARRDDGAQANNTTAGTNSSDGGQGQEADGDSHLAHPETWTTGQEPATDKQKGFIHVLEKQQGKSAGANIDELNKSQASEVIDKLKN